MIFAKGVQRGEFSSVTGVGVDDLFVKSAAFSPSPIVNGEHCFFLLGSTTNSSPFEIAVFEGPTSRGTSGCYPGLPGRAGAGPGGRSITAFSVMIFAKGVQRGEFSSGTG